MNAVSSSHAHVSPELEHIEPNLRVVESDPKVARRIRVGNQWFLVTTIVLSVLFAIGFMKYVVDPVTSTLASSSIEGR